MRLIQTDLRQTGIAVLEDGTKIPLFSHNIAGEVEDLNLPLKTTEVYACMETSTLSEASKIYKETGCLNRYYMDQLRSGFNHSSSLNQASDICYYL